jgi:twitching motility protein PilJ
MAFKLPFKLPFFGRPSQKSSQPAASDAATTEPSGTVAPDEKARRKTIKLPLIGGLSATRQLYILGAAAPVFGMLLLGLLWQQVRTSEVRDTHRAIIAEMRVFSQAISKAAVLLNTQASPQSFNAIREGREHFDTLLGLLAAGGAGAGFNSVAIDPELSPALGKVDAAWLTVDKSLAAILPREKPLQTMNTAVDKGAATAEAIVKLAVDRPALQEYAKLAGSISRRARVILLLPPPQHLEAFDIFRGNIRTFNEQAPAALQVVQGKDREALQKAIDSLNAVVTDFEINILTIDAAKSGGAKLQPEAEALAKETDDLFRAIGTRRGGGELVSNLWLAIAGFMLVLVLAMMLKVYGDDTRARQEEAQRRQREAEANKDATQQAILRLMNEMGDLADGDLTVRTTVTEDITGAIADSVNYAIEEMAVMVRQINESADQVAAASGATQETSKQLLAATERQSKEIQATSAHVLQMAESMRGVSGSALESAQVARQSLEAAQKGASAVENSIKGMNEIRGQIQETSKRIKRLGESSQEIGEIVELISDITEQTNVLALNAAIQAASAGEAGRGFTVVAEEVQRLAERSGEATKQIAAIVKTIQADTHDAVSAMENSTQGVVEGTKLSDAAGQALEEISDVSKQLAELIAKISTDTQEQAKVATGVAAAMEDIRQVTDQTSEGTKRTSVSIGELAELSAEFKRSVAGFKV